MTWPTVEAAICAVWHHEDLRAIDTEAMANATTRDKPNPGKRYTVRASGHEGGYVVREPISAVERARVLAALERLTWPERVLATAWCVRTPQRAALEYLRKPPRGGACWAASEGLGFRITGANVAATREAGLAKLRELLVGEGLVAA